MNVTPINSLRVQLFADGADLKGIEALAANPLVKGFTTNPTLMRQAGVTDYVAFAKDVLKIVPDRPVSFEVFADDLDTMAKQARVIASWGPNVYVKIPVTTTKGEFVGPIVSELSKEGVQLNVTAILTLEQVQDIADVLHVGTPAVVSVFAGRIADTGRDPIAVMSTARMLLESRPKAELLWASPRELLNIYHAEEAGCHIITVGHDLLKKLSLVGKDLAGYSLETVAMFYRDATAAGYDIPLHAPVLA